MPRKKKGERYIDRWRREHKEVRLYLKREEYEVLERLASEQNMTVKEFILKNVEKFSKAARREYSRGYKRGYAKAVEDFVNDPYAFYITVRDVYKYGGYIALFEAPCAYCGEPMVFTHRDADWESEVKPRLLEAFRYWYHVRCKR